MKKILVLTDFSDNALNAFRYAIWFADQYRANLYLLHRVVEPLDYPATEIKVQQAQVEIAEEEMKRFIERGITQIHTTYEPMYSPKVASKVVAGTSESQIKNIAKEKEMDLIIMGTNGAHSNLQKADENIGRGTMEQAPCPVLVVPEKAIRQKIKTIGYSTDLQPSDPYHIWRIGRLLAPFAAILRVVNIKKQPEERPLTMRKLKDFFSQNIPSLQINFHNIITKNIAEELATFEENWNVDLLVLAKPTQGFLQYLFHQNVTKKLALYTAGVPMLILTA